MRKCIRYMDGVEWINVPYSDETLIAEIQMRVEAIRANVISLWFCECENNHGSIYVSIQNVRSVNENCKILSHDTLYLHDIDLTEESWKSNLREYQREKQLIKRTFPLLKVTSNFR